MGNPPVVQPGDGEVIEGGRVEQVSDLPFEERRHHAATARMLAYLLVATLGVTIALQYGLTVLLLWRGRDIGPLDKLFNVLLPVLASLVGSATTFYFTKEKN